MILLLLISLYTSRVILEVLGIEDFGIYNLIQGIIVSFSFLNGSLVSASQRFLSYALGKNNYKEYIDVFSLCIVIFISIAFLLCLILEPVGLWMIKEKLVIPIDRLSAAIKLFHISVGIFFLSFIRIPFSAVIVANERMDYFAYIGIAEAFVKLTIVLLLSILSYDKLVVYGTFLLLSNMLFLLICSIYCFRRLGISFNFILKKKLSVQILSFSGWSLYEGIANIGKTEVINFLLNSFYGVMLNAAVGVAKQVNSAVIQFVSNFQTAFQPQITKTYASSDQQRLNYLIENTSKYSYLIFITLVIPICFNLPFLMKIWLVEVPDYAVAFTCFFIASFVFETLGGPFWITAHSIGNIRDFQVVSGTIRLISIPMTYILLIKGFDVSYIFAPLVISELLVFMYRLLYIHKKISFSITQYARNVLLKLVVVTVLNIICVQFIFLCVENNFLRLILSALISTSIIVSLSFLYIMSKGERVKVLSIIRKRLCN